MIEEELHLVHTLDRIADALEGINKTLQDMDEGLCDLKTLADCVMYEPPRYDNSAGYHYFLTSDSP